MQITKNIRSSAGITVTENHRMNLFAIPRPLKKYHRICIHLFLLSSFFPLSLFLSYITMGKDYYAILGVPKNADDDAIKKAYRKQGLLVIHAYKHAKRKETDYRSLQP